MPPVWSLIVVAALALGAPERTAPPADPPGAAEASKPPVAPSKGDQAVVCKRVEVTGTRFASQECHTRAEWTAITVDARSFTDKMTTGPCMAGCRAR